MLNFNVSYMILLNISILIQLKLYFKNFLKLSSLKKSFRKNRDYLDDAVVLVRFIL